MARAGKTWGQRPFVRYFGHGVKTVWFLPRYLYLRWKYRRFTMIQPMFFAANLALIDWWRRRDRLDAGIVVECGTWRGGMSFGMAELCPEARELHCFDSFEGLPPAGDLDGETARRLHEANSLMAGRNTASLEEFHEGMQLLAPSARSRITAHKGWFEDTLREFQPAAPIKILRLDGDWYESTMTCLERLYDQCAPGALIIIDDYLQWEGCTRAVHDFLSRRKLPCRIREFFGVTFMLKV